MALAFEHFYDLIDHGITCPDAAVTVWYRSYTELTDTDCDGATYYFEVVGDNDTGSSQTIELVYWDGDSWEQVKTVTMTADGSVTRYRSTSFSMISGTKTYAVRTPSVATGSTLDVDCARIVVVQTSPTKTRVQIPLIGPGYNSRSADNTGGAIDSRTTATYGQGASLFYSIWKKVEADWATLTGSCWTIQAVLRNSAGTTPSLALCQSGTTTIVTGSELTPTSTTLDLYTADFATDATNFSDNTSFEARIKGDGTNLIYVAKAALFVKVTSISKLDVMLRFARQYTAGTTNVVQGFQRIQLNSSSYDGDTVAYYSEGVGYCNENVAASGAGAVDSTTTTGTSYDVSGTGVNFNSGTAARVQTSAFTPPTSGYDIFYERYADPPTASNSIRQMAVVVHVEATASTPMVTTAAITDITPTTATSGGIITDIGGSTLTAYGVCWNTTGSPTIADSHTDDS